MVSAYWGQPLYQGDIARWLRTSEIGTPARNITNLSSYGFNVVYREGSLQFLVASLQQGVPCITFVQTEDLPYWEVDTAHAVVFAGLEDDTVHLYDPAFPDAPKRVSVEAFMLAWSFFDYAVAVFTLPK
jgi:ABC-type bacteriocin/lantibiotic exporter with double-glycine peptidase domain